MRPKGTDLKAARDKLAEQVQRHRGVMLRRGADSGRLDAAEKKLAGTIRMLKRPDAYDAKIGLEAHYAEERNA